MSKIKTTNYIEKTEDQTVQHDWQDILQSADDAWYRLGLAETSQAGGLQLVTTSEPSEPVYYDGVEYLSTKAYNGFFNAGGYLQGGDWSGNSVGELQVSGQVQIGDAYFTAHTMEWRSIDPLPSDDPFVANWMTDYGEWIFKVTTDDGMGMVFTMRQCGIGAHIVGVDYEVDNQGNPLGAMPDIGKPFILEFTKEAVEEILDYHWEPAPGQYDPAPVDSVSHESSLHATLADTSLNVLIIPIQPEKLYAGVEHSGGLTLLPYDDSIITSSEGADTGHQTGQLQLSGNVTLSLASSSFGDSYYDVSSIMGYEVVTSTDHVG